MADAIVELARMDSGDWVKMRQSALERARFYAPEKVINRVYGDLIELGSGSDESSQWTHDHAVIASRGVDSKGANSGKSAFHQGFRVAPVGLAEMPTPTPSFCAVQASANPCSLSAAPHQRSPDMLRQSLPATLSGRSAKISGAADSVDSGRHARFFMQM